MPKNKDGIETPDYEKEGSIDKIEKRILECQLTIVRKYRLRTQAESARREMVASYNEQVKHLKEELDHALGVLSGWEDRKKVVSAQGAAEDEDEEDAKVPAAQVLAQPIPTIVPATIPHAPLAPQPITSSVPLPPSPPKMMPPPAPPASQALSQGGSLVPFPRKPAAA